MKQVITLLTIGLSFGTFAQEFSGKATYFTKQSFKKVDAEDSSPEVTAKEFNEAMQKASEKTYILEFTKNESLYTEEESLQPISSNGISISYASGNDGKLYKNLKENYSILESDVIGKTLLIQDSLQNSGWELTTESKTIGNYTAYKATKTVHPEDYLSENQDREFLEFLSMIDVKYRETQTYIAWYTPEIPIANGPEKFGGLPGLILELHANNMVYLCSEIELNPKKSVKINRPKGQTISQQEFYDIIMNIKEQMQ